MLCISAEEDVDIDKPTDPYGSISEQIKIRNE